MKINKFNESIKSQPKFSVGDRCVYVYPIAFGTGRKVLSVLDDDMTISGEPFWYDYDNHPNKGYWLYPIDGKANECPEDFLILYTGQEEGDIVQ